MRARHRQTGRIIRYRIGLQDPPWEQIDTAQDAPKRPVSASREPDSLEVPDGTVEEVLTWAGDDPARRRAAKLAEQAGKKRKTLLNQL